MKQSYILLAILFVGAIFSSCNKLFPFKFSDANNVTLFEINTNSTPGIVLSKDIQINTNVQDTLNGDYGQITLTVLNGSQYFPLVFNVNIEVSPGASIHNWPDELQLAFKTPSDFKSFYVVSSSGKIKKWIIKIADNTPIPPDPNKKNTNISSFTFTPVTQGSIIIDPTDVNIAGDSVLLSYDSDGSTDITYPITIKEVVIKLPNGAYFEDYTEGAPFDFTNPKDVKHITVVAADSTTKKVWNIAIKKQVLTGGSNAADITEFTMMNVLPSAVSVPASMKGLIDVANRVVYIPEYKAYDFATPVKIVMANLSISENAQLSSDYSGIFTFSDFNDIKIIQITAENGKQKNWQIRLLYSPQLTNSNFEDWSSTSGYAVVGGGQWVANNFLPNSMVSSVSLINGVGNAFEGSKSAEITTQYIVRGAAGINSITPVSGGILFLGKYNFSASESAIRNPLSMYDFGIGFNYAPTYLHVAFKYNPYTPVIKGSISSFGSAFGNAIPNFNITNLVETDYCNILIQVVDASGKVIGTGNFSTNKAFNDWTEVYIPVLYSNATAMPTKLDIRFAASKEGLNYQGGSGTTGGSSSTIGSKLTIDNVELLYTPIGYQYHPTPAEL